MSSNPYTITLPANTQMVINATSSADNTQYVTVTEPTSNTNLIFKGNSEGIPMTLSDGRNVILVGATGSPRTFTFQFNFTAVGSQRMETSQLGPVETNTAGRFTTYSLRSEDQGGSDYNDTRAYVILET